jgi:hypothetical protein
MMKTTAFIGLFLLTAFAPTKWVKNKLPEGVTVSVPDNMLPMTPEDMAQRFPSVRAPLGAFTNTDRITDFSVNISATTWPDGDVELASKFFRSSLQNLYDRLDMISEGTQMINKKKFIFFEFESRTSGDPRKQGQQDPILKYTYIQYLLLNDKTLVFSFACPKEQKAEWQPIAHEMMKRIQVNGSMGR